MGAEFDHINSYKEFGLAEIGPETPRQVFKLAEKVLLPIIKNNNGTPYSHIIIATTCPDTLAPSIGQALADKYNNVLGKSQLVDLVQGCAGGVSSMILASQLVEVSKSSVLVINADAAQKATSAKSSIHEIFGNGAFGCVIRYGNSSKRLIYYKSKQFKGLSNVVTVNLGHDSDRIIAQKSDIKTDPRLHLGLSMNNVMALKLMRQAEAFYNEFVMEACEPDILLLHQVNPEIMQFLQKVFSKYKIKFVNVANEIGNCGTATTGIALDMENDDIAGKKVMLCSYGTGGVITAGMWQF
jgi:3-oxoacyl-[acyl-carrier-protein] synthase III